MTQPLLTEDIDFLVSSLERVRSTIAQLSPYPRAFFAEQQSVKDEPIGPRLVYWLASAVSSVTAFEGSSKKLDFPTEDLADYALSRYTVSKKQHRHPFWLSSVLLFYRELDKLSLCSGDALPAEKYETIRQRIEEYERALLAKRRTRHPTTPQLDYYSEFWILEALGTALSPSDNRWIRFLARSREVLRSELALHSAQSPAMHHMLLALSARAVAQAADRGVEECTSAILQREVRHAAGICFAARRSIGFGRKLVLNIPGFGRLFNAPWEDIFVLCGVGVDRLPDRPEVIPHILDATEERFERISTGELGVIDEGHEAFPKPSPFYTLYLVALLSRLGAFLQGKLTSLMSQQIKKAESVWLRSVEPEVPRMDGPDFLDTVECVGTHLRERFDCSDGAAPSDKVKACNTILLFGPPGTGKTTLVKSLTNYLNEQEQRNTVSGKDWSLLTLNPGVFLTDDSYSSIFSTVTRVFAAFRILDHCVVFLDEAEELMRSREDGDDRLGRMFTAAMLPQLNTLANSESLFVFATNHVQKMDPAAIRKGRFSLRKGVGWIAPASLGQHVDRVFPSVAATVRTVLVENLQRRPIKEISDIVRTLLAHPSVTNDEMSISQFFDGWKSYWPEETVEAHTEACRSFDDTWVPEPAL